MKILNVFFIVIFILSAAVQYNDPDPYIWMPLYLYGAFICWLALKRIYRPLLYLAGFLVYSGYALFLLFNKDGVITWATAHGAENIVQSMKATKPWIEATREFFGLLILLAALVSNWYWLKKKGAAESGKKQEVL
jgi:hypothetical protein